MAKRRILKEFQSFEEEPMENVKVEIIDKDVFNWHIHILGPAGTVYEGGFFTLNFYFPFDYPLKPPKCSFETKIYHPNIGTKGEICYDFKKEWEPIKNIKSIIEEIYYLLRNPSPDDPMLADIAYQYKFDLPAFCKTAKEFTKKYAISK